MYPVSNCIRSIVSEKELREKECLMMMSVTRSEIGWGWFLSQYAFLAVSGVITAAISSQFYARTEISYLVLLWLSIQLATYQYCTVIAAINTTKRYINGRR